MEIEAKFRTSVETFTTLPLLHTLGPFQLTLAPTPEQQRNTYYDTRDKRLQSAHFGLRIRQIGSRQIATLKGAATVVDGLYTRGEWEHDVASDQPQQWPAGELRDRVFALTEGASLLATVVIETKRSHVYASREAAPPFAEISLDEGVMLAAAQCVPFREVEVELLPAGERADFDALLTLLRQQFRLTPEPRSKLERALDLLHS